MTKTFRFGKIVILCFAICLVLIRISSIKKHFATESNWNREQVNEYELFTDEATNHIGSTSSFGIYFLYLLFKCSRFKFSKQKVRNK